MMHAGRILLLLALFCAAGCEERPPGPRPLTHGVAPGDVRSDRGVFWARTDRASVLHVELRPSGEAQSRQASADQWELRFHAEARAANDFTAAPALSGLQSGSVYEYRAWFDRDAGATEPAENEVARGRFRTAPAPERNASLELLWGGDISGQNVCRDAGEGLPIFRAMQARKPDLFLALGDLVYADDDCLAEGRYGNAQLPLQSDEARAVSIEGFRDRWRYNRADPVHQDFLRRTPMLAVWDDHEVKNDFGPAGDRAEAPPYPEDAAGRSLMPIGLQSFLEWNPVERDPEDGRRIYRSFRYGKNAELFILDTRQYRDPGQAPDDGPEPKTMLGAGQRKWLIDGLKKSDARWKLIVSSVPIAIPTGSNAETEGRDGWADYETETGYERELRQILEELARADVSNLVFLTTDVHFAAVFRYRPRFAFAPDFTFYEAASGPLNAGVFPVRKLDETFGPERLFLYGPRSPEAVQSWSEAKRWFNFGALSIDAGGSLTLEILRTDGTSVYRLELTPGGPSR